ncbi:MAG: DUF1573 domain-containing protein [Acidobacteria bacterium]|nr:DUF1573 domain-containing protein [Acidobacteriota bacterium]
MKRLLSSPFSSFFVLVLGLCSSTLAQPRAFVAQSVVDVGVIARGNTVEHAFEIRNEGDATLEILEVKPTCGCTVVDFDSTIAPGASGNVVAKLDSKGLRGPIAKTVRVFTNDGRNPQIDLVIKANVRAWVEASPGYARFLAVLGEGGEPVVQTIYSDEPGELVVTKVRSPYPFVEVDYREAGEEEGLSGKDGRQWIIEMSLAPNAPEGSFADFVTVELQHPRLKRLRIPVSGFVRPVIAVLPRVVDFGRKDLSIPQTAILEVKNLGGPDVTLGTIESTIAGLTPEVEVIEEGRLYRLRMTLAPGMAKGDFRGTLTIPTSSQLQPLVEVTVRGTVL